MQKVFPFRVNLVLVLALVASAICSAKMENKEGSCSWSHVSVLERGMNISGTQFISEDNLFPSWLNLTLVEVGQRFAVNNWGHLSLIHMLALLYDICIPVAKHTLSVSGATSRVEDAAKRYTATAAHVMIWYENFIGNPKQRKVLLQSLKTIRRVHTNASFDIQRKLKSPNYFKVNQAKAVEYWNSKPESIFHDEGFWNALRKDITQSNIALGRREHCVAWKYNGIPITQFGQALTQFSFAGLTVLFHKNLGISRVSKEELRGFIHLWAFLGNALGMQEKYNICMEDELGRSEQLFREILNAYYVPTLFEIDELARIQLSAFLEAMQTSFPALSPKLLIFKFLRDMVEIGTHNIYRQLSISEKLKLAVLDRMTTNRFDFNRWVLGYIGKSGLNVNVEKHFGKNLGSDWERSQKLYYK